MAIELMVMVWDSALPKDDKNVAAHFANYASEDGTGIYVSNARMVWRTGYTKQGLQKITRRLEDAGILELLGKHPRYDTNEWVFHAHNLPQFHYQYQEWVKEYYRRRTNKSDKYEPEGERGANGVCPDKQTGFALTKVITKDKKKEPPNPPSPKKKSIKQQAKEIYLQLLPKYLELFHKKDPKRFPEHKPGNTTIINNIVSLLKSKHVGDYGIFADNYINAIEHAAGWKFLYETNFFNLVWFTKKKRDEPYGWEKCMERGKSLDKQSEDVDIRRMI